MNQALLYIERTVSPTNVMLVLGLTLFGGAYVGRLFQKLKIPQVVGYIAIGIILGASGLRILNADLTKALQPFNSFALAIIGFMVGGELRITVVKKYGKQFTYILLFEALTAFLVVGAVASLACWFLFKNLALAISLGLLLGSISSATAPAATTDVLWENKSKGPLTTMVLGIVAMDDAVALLLFAASTSIAGALMGKETGGFTIAILKLLYEIGAAVAIGLGSGLALKGVTRRIVDEAKVLAFSMGALLLVIGISQATGADMILAAMTMGFFTVNFSPKKSAETFKVVDNFAPPIYVLFFVLVGAKLDVRHVTLITGIVALVYVLGRTAGKFLGSWLGSLLSSAPIRVRKYIPFCLFSQAGVAIGLSIVAGQTFPGIVGDTILATVAATTFLVQVIGPPFVKFAITKAGEVGLDVTDEDLLVNATATDLIDKDTPNIAETACLTKVINAFASNDGLYYPVIDDSGHLQGIITVDKIKEAFALSEYSEALLAWDLMEEVTTTCSPKDPAAQVNQRLLTGNLDYLPVVDSDGMAVGLVDRQGIRRFVTRRMLERERILDELETRPTKA